jgi:archaemetzincin
MEQQITLISFGYFEKDYLEKIVAAVAIQFPYQVRIKEAHIDLSEYYDPTRRQYNAHKLLKVVDEMALPGTIRKIGLFNVDLFIPILTYIFGQAMLGGNSGIASMFRLNNELYGMPKDNDLLIRRFRKEVIHELGHTFGLIHCNGPVCVMRSSTYVEDIDQKEERLCPVCLEEIKKITMAAH